MFESASTWACENQRRIAVQVLQVVRASKLGRMLKKTRQNLPLKKKTKQNKSAFIIGLKGYRKIFLEDSDNEYWAAYL